MYSLRAKFQNLKINHLNISKGGAGIAAYRLDEGLKLLNVESKVITPDSLTPKKKSFRYFKRKLWEKYNTYSYKGIDRSKFEVLSTDQVKSDINYPALLDCDVVNLHWISHFLDWSKLFSSSVLPKTVWTFHDMNPFMGFAHYIEDSQKLNSYLAQNRPLEDMSRSDIDHKCFLRKKKIIEKLRPCQLKVVSPSRWLAKEAENSFFKKFDIQVIPNGIDTSIYRPIKREKCLELFNIPNKNFIQVLFTAIDLKVKRKGLDIMINALKKIEAKNQFQILIMGGGVPPELSDFNVYSLGYIKEDYKKACAYSLADFFVISSREDNFPNTILESLACGTPVLGAETGGIPDSVRPGITGELFKSGSSKDLATKMSNWINSESYEQMPDSCRQIAIQEYDIKVQGAAYKKLYEEFLDE